MSRAPSLYRAARELRAFTGCVVRIDKPQRGSDAIIIEAGTARINLKPWRNNGVMGWGCYIGASRQVWAEGLFQVVIDAVREQEREGRQMVNDAASARAALRCFS